MDVKIKKSFRGYDPEEFIQEVSVMEQTFEKKLKDLEAEFEGIENESEAIKRKIEALRDEFTTAGKLREELSSTLVKAYLGSLEEVYNTTSGLDSGEQERLNKLSEQELQYENARRALRDLIFEIQTKIDNFKSKLFTKDSGR